MRHRFMPGITAVLIAVACTDAPPPVIATARRGDPTLRRYESCAQLEADWRRQIGDRAEASLLFVLEHELGYGEGEGGGSVDATASNDQENDADAGDTVKNDGSFIYTLNESHLHILGVPEFGQLASLSSLPIEGQPGTMLLAGDRAIVTSQVDVSRLGQGDPLAGVLFDDTGAARTENLMKVTVVELGTDRREIRVERELYIEGRGLTGRRTDDAILLASYASFDVPGLRYSFDLPDEVYGEGVSNAVRRTEINRAYQEAVDENFRVLAATDLSQFMPRMYERMGEVIVELGPGSDACRNVSMPGDGGGSGFTSFLRLGPGEGDIVIEAEHIVTNEPVLHASTDTLLLTEGAHGFSSEAIAFGLREETNVHRFRLDGATTSYTGSGRVPGSVLKQFALDVHDGVVRVASTTIGGGEWPEMSHLTTLGGETTLEVLGNVTGIGPGDILQSVRYADDEAYLVTASSINRLFTVDLKDPRQPRSVGTSIADVPGVPTSIHPLGDHLLAIGVGTETSLEYFDWTSILVAMVDITDRATPHLESSVRLTPGESTLGWQVSINTLDHKAFSYWGPHATVAVPLLARRDQPLGREYVSQLVLVRAEADHPLEVLGAIDHSEFNSANPAHEGAVLRSYLLGDFIYAVSDRAVTCHRISDLTLMASVQL